MWSKNASRPGAALGAVPDREAFCAGFGLGYCNSVGEVMQVISEKQAYQFLEGYSQRNKTKHTGDRDTLHLMRLLVHVSLPQINKPILVDNNTDFLMIKETTEINLPKQETLYNVGKAKSILVCQTDLKFKYPVTFPRFIKAP